MRVLFSCTAADGHFLPLVPLARAFATAGHDVAVATAASYAERVEAAGLEVLSAGVGADALEPEVLRGRARLLALPARERRPHAFNWRFATLEAPTKIDELLTGATAWRPELIIHETSDLAAPAVAAALDVPSAQHAIGRRLPQACLDAAAPTTAALWRRLGLEPEPASGLYRGPYVDICPPSLQDEPAPAGTVVEFLRPQTATTGDETWSSRLAGARPTVYLTLGTVFNDPTRLRVLLGALASLDCTVLATVGLDNDPAELEPRPANLIVEQYIPQADILAFCRVAVGHGGSGSTLAALAHGVPMLLLPRGADQFENAAACAAIGAAIVLHPEDVTPPAVQAAVRFLLDDPDSRAAAESVAREIASMPSADEVVSALTAFTAATRP